MRNFKRFLTLTLAVLMVVSMFAFNASAAQFTDVDAENEYLNKAVNLLNHVGVVKGTSETTFGTDELVTREQMAAFIYRLMKKGNSVEGGDNSSTFTDLEDPTFFFMVSWANAQGIIKGTSATTFEPKGSITLQDAYTMIIRALGYEDEGTLSYPFEFIGIAEQKGVELDEGLDSSVSYTDALTRGDVAILLYNAFFAETGIPETKQVEKLIGTGDKATWVLQTVTEYPTLCEKIFDVLEVEYQAVATPNYTFGESETTKSLGYDAVLFNYVGEERTDAPAQFYAAAEDLALDGELDDYIMSHFTMYVTLDDDDAVEEILYAEPLMNSKTVNEIKLETLSSNTAYSYYGDDADNAKRLSGKVLIDGKEAYFYNAPYSYATPTYPTGASDTDKYDLRNEKNLKFISMALLGDVDDAEYSYTLDNINFVDNDDEYFTNDSVTLIDALSQVYTGGLYEATVYDVDGDGLYDYINYMPYSFAIVDTDDDYTFEEDGIDENVIYTNEAVVEGAEFADEDFILGYFNQAANYIKVAQVIEPITANIVDINNTSIELSTGEKVAVKDGWKLVANYASDVDLSSEGYVLKNIDWTEFDNLLSAAAYDADDAKFYIYDGVILFQEGVESKVTFDSNLIIITPDEDGTVYETGTFNAATGTKTTYAYAWVDGEMKYVPINTDADIYPSIKDDGDAYVNKVATYSVDGDGLYTIKLLGNAYDDKDMADEDYIGLSKDFEDLKDEKDDTLQVYGEENSAYLVRRLGSRFNLRDGVTTDAGLLVDFDLTVDANSVIVIRNEYEDGDGETVVDFVTLTASDLTQTIENELENVQYVVVNNPDYSNRENLVLFFAEVNGEELSIKGTTSSKAERIISMMNVKLNADKKYYIEYTVFNPYTGQKETLAGTQTSSSSTYSSKFTYGDIVTVSGGKVEDNAGDSRVGTVLAANTDLFWIVGYDEAESAIEVMYVPADGDDSTAQVYYLDVEGAAVTMIGNQSNNGEDMVKWGGMTTLTVSDLGSSDKSLLAVNKNYAAEEGDTLKTVYGKYIKAYIQIEWEDEDAPEVVDEDTGFNGSVQFVTVISNTNESATFCDVK